MQEEWFYLDTGYQDAAINMALDESLLRWHSEGKIPPTLRFYGWAKPTLSAGYFQKVDRTIDLDAVSSYNCQFVRRLTGGSAVLHDDELTYSIVISESHPDIPASVTEAYHVLSEGLVEGYKNLGLTVDYANPDRRSAVKDRSAVCFEMPAFYEMVVDGKKISGNAQTRKHGVLLQHGSIPMSMDVDMLYDLFRFPSEKSRERRRNKFKDKAASINELTNKVHTYDEMRDAFCKGFQTALNISLKQLELSEAQWTEVYQLAESKYNSDEWNYKKTSKERITNGEE